MITVDHMHFEIIENYRDAFDEEQFQKKYSEVLNKYDYIVGDIGYEKLRLAGFFRDGKSKVDRDKKVSAVQDYLYEYCNFGCAYFILRKVPKSEIKEMIENGELEAEPGGPPEDDAGESEQAEDREDGVAHTGETSDQKLGDEPEDRQTDAHSGAAEKQEQSVQEPVQKAQKPPRKRRNPSRNRKKPQQTKHGEEQKQTEPAASTNKTLAAHKSFKKS